MIDKKNLQKMRRRVRTGIKTHTDTILDGTNRAQPPLGWFNAILKIDGMKEDGDANLSIHVAYDVGNEQGGSEEYRKTRGILMDTLVDGVEKWCAERRAEMEEGK